jgi:hypothetical protein
MCCVVELENVLVKDYSAELCMLPKIPKVSGATIFCALLWFDEIKRIEADLARLKQAGNRIVLYFFDCWDAPSVLSAKRRQLRDRLQPSLRLENVVDRLCFPFKVLDNQLVKHVPLAVDTTLANGLNKDRPISVLAYGRQPPELTKALAETFNDPAGPFIFHHTDHMTISTVDDFRLHRMHFWKMAQSSQIAITYDPSITSPHRVPISIVGQRFYESLAAGCVLVGKRPTTDEADELLNWQDSTIDLPDDPTQAVEELRDLLADPGRLEAIRERNVENVRARHDWRNRIPGMLSTEPGPGYASGTRQLAAQRP